MLVPLKWLRDYVDIDINAKDFADKMTMTGSKVERVESFGEEIEKVVVGKILEVEQHPNADKLVVTKIDIGNEVIQVVTGAKNISKGDYIPVALVGAKLPGGIKIKKGKLRGETSEGMMCSSDELGIPSQYVEEYKRDGIYILDHEESYELGKDIREILGINDSLIEFEITSNRPDCRSIIGIAREAAVTLNKEIKYPIINVKESDENIDFNIKIENNDLCPRYSARMVKDIKIGPSPYWMQRRLIEAGLRPINNIVDITNYVMLELGQPLHAFDLREIGGNKIVVKTAQDKEKFVTLDEQERTLDCSTIVITNGEKTLGIAGVMGGANSEIKDDTTEILIESANFKAESIRSTSKKLGLRTEASARYEKGIDINLVETAINRAAQLIEELGAGRVLKGIVDNYENKVEKQKIVVRPQKINSLLGVNVPLNDFIGILESLEFKCNLVEDNKLEIEVPSFRLDIEQEADILEEIARIYGYENIPSASLYGNTTVGIKTESQKFEDKVKNNLTSMGINEILTYSFVSPRGVDKINTSLEDEKRNFVKLINPLGEETSVMRTTLIPNMLDVVYTNYSHKVNSFDGFEIGNTFKPNLEFPTQTKKLCIGMYGNNKDFFYLKGAIEEMLFNVGFVNYEIIPEKENLTFHPGRCANIVYNNICIGTFGELHPDVLDNYNLNNRVYIAEIDLDSVFGNSNFEKRYKSLPKYPAITRDIALLVKDEIFVKQIEDIIKENAQEILESYELFDVYKGAQIQEGHKSIAYSIVYRSQDRTLTDEDVSKVHDKIVRELSEKLDANLRSN